MPTGGVAHDADLGDAQVFPAPHDADGLLEVAQRDLVVADRETVLQHAVGNPPGVEPVMQIPSLMGLRFHNIGPAGAHDDTESVGVAGGIHLHHGQFIVLCAENHESGLRSGDFEGIRGAVRPESYGVDLGSAPALRKGAQRQQEQHGKGNEDLFHVVSL